MTDIQYPCREHGENTFLYIKVRPSSSRRNVEVTSESGVIICVHSPPEKGRANKEALQVLSQALGLPRSRLEIIKGHASKTKTVLIHSMLPDEVMKRLASL